MGWLMLITAGLLEVVWVVALKYSENFTRLWPSVIMVVSIVSSFLLLNLAISKLPLGLSYAVWTGMGAAGAVLAGIILFKEPTSLLHMVFLGMIIAGIIGLNFVSPSHG